MLWSDPKDIRNGRWDWPSFLQPRRFYTEAWKSPQAFSLPSPSVPLMRDLGKKHLCPVVSIITLKAAGMGSIVASVERTIHLQWGKQGRKKIPSVLLEGKRQNFLNRKGKNYSPNSSPQATGCSPIPTAIHVSVIICHYNIRPASSSLCCSSKF